ncbi:malectin domain-containing carbohydrate-binding protein [Terrimonas alba]|uniref:malectin domain-containing carbohydrate-binding protein n=1 Tax=Terrimonas alba TaxID=3349636 RepID=UPI0035F4D408
MFLRLINNEVLRFNDTRQKGRAVPGKSPLGGRGFLFCAFVSLWFNLSAQRQDILLNSNWYSIATSDDKLLPANSYQSLIDGSWEKVAIPHNWDQYDGYRRLLHGNRHGDSWYRKTFSITQKNAGKRFFLFFEGVGSYATVYLNNRKVGEHAGGRTTFTIDVTDVIKTDGSNNEVAVRAYHPSDIKGLPWVCGGCGAERGFSEGSQPFGIFRPVHLIVTNDVKIEPFGVHAWAEINSGKATLFINTTIKNYSSKKRNIRLIHQLVSKDGKVVAETSSGKEFLPGDSITISQNPHLVISQFHRWSVEDPYLYKIVSVIKENNIVIDKQETDFGFRTINWRTSTNQFYLNDKPVFINGVAEYEHLLGQSHAFSNEQVIARMKWLQAAGFIAFRDGHQPHNLLYGKLCNQMGILWWTQLSAHIWYDSPAFRKQFKELLKEWVIERRNDPAVVLWGLQNESKLPEDFAKECTELIRSLDPTASSQRLVTTCNGGSGTDWDVPQNWTGTYGGDPKTYANDLKKQILVGEYGAWRTLDLHSEGGFVQNGTYSEDRMTQLMEQKIRLAESAKDSIAGHFFWLLTSHDNPGRVQGGEGLRELDRIGPVNYKGLLTPWEEPTDAFYMYRGNYASKEKEPMVYIVSHTWSNRWMQGGIKDSIYVYSNCDEVELFNDIDSLSLGKRKRNGRGTHFQWDQVAIKYNLLYAVGYVNGKKVAKDIIVLNHLPQSPNFNRLFIGSKPLTKPQAGYNYIYRINCGGPDYKDMNGNHWRADKGFAESWTKDFPGMPAEFASQRRTFSPVKGSKDWKLFQAFRYGRDKLKYEFSLPDGEYRVEFYFIEPWSGIGGGAKAKGLRIFDVAINGKTVLDDLDICSEVGTNHALKKIVKAKITGGKMIVSFPEVKVGQALIAAIAIASLNREIKAPQPSSLVTNLSCSSCSLQSWMDIGDKPFANADVQFNSLPSNLYGADWFQINTHSLRKSISFTLKQDADVFIASGNEKLKPIGFENTSAQIITDENAGKRYTVFRKRFPKNAKVEIADSLLVMLLPVTTMQPAYDLKVVTQYKTNVVRLTDGVQKEQFAGRDCAIVKTNNQVLVEWPIQTGVADIYSITLKYFYGLKTPVAGKLQLIGAGNTMMLDESVQFSFTNPGKWNQFTINTGTMINAGNYTVRLIIDRAGGLAISGIDIQ